MILTELSWFERFSKCGQQLIKNRGKCRETSLNVNKPSEVKHGNKFNQYHIGESLILLFPICLNLPLKRVSHPSTKSIINYPASGNAEERNSSPFTSRAGSRKSLNGRNRISEETALDQWLINPVSSWRPLLGEP